MTAEEVLKLKDDLARFIEEEVHRVDNYKHQLVSTCYLLNVAANQIIREDKKK